MDECPPELTAMGLLRGELASGVYAVIIVTDREREGRRFRSFREEVTRSFIEPITSARRDVRGAKDAVRIQGRIHLEEGLLCPDDIEAITMLVTSTRRRFVTLTIRTCPQAQAGPHIERIVDSFVVR